ncbi:MAG TPA: 16S rRNA (adenine(1518)-N(6)/adenine(1519)-N(6))-dimethyltransferase RsmA [Gaiellaceae bacterium]|nr:16S rRNA (adenine(1518)-N(6)/adenine(1519)-N(6))-dimethyltransferase RsmA [Gaiellaceae bacterium]
MTRDVAPKRSLGQHFLVDENILGVIGRLAQLDENDVVLEIGPGLGVLTAFLADRVRHVHAVEVDPTLEPALRAAIEPRTNVALQFADATRFDTAALEPQATKLVSNLPYNVAATVVLHSLERAPSIGLWCVMVQREVGERFFAAPGTKAYGAVSVLVQLSARRTGTHAVSRSVFRPRPRVDSMLVAFARVASPPGIDRVKAVVQAAFAHRRKTLPNSLELAGLARRDEASAALAALGHPASTRGEALAPQEFVRLAELLP